MTSISVETVSNDRFQLGEGPHWLESRGTLLLVDIDAGAVYELNVVTGTKETHIIGDGGGRVGFVVPYKANENIWAIGLENTVIQYDSASRKIVKTLTDVTKDCKILCRINDGKADPVGNLFFGTMPRDDFSMCASNPCNLYCLSVDGRRQIIHDGVGLSNGLAWTKDVKKMFFIDSLPTGIIYQFDYNGAIPLATSKKVLINFKTHPEYTSLTPDGMTIDTEDNLWVACFGGGCVVKIDPKTTNLLLKIDIPSINTTSVAFGGPNYTELYVTSAGKHNVPEEIRAKQPQGGAVFRIRGLAVKGLPPSSYAGAL